MVPLALFVLHKKPVGNLHIVRWLLRTAEDKGTHEGKACIQSPSENNHSTGHSSSNSAVAWMDDIYRIHLHFLQ